MLSLENSTAKECLIGELSPIIHIAFGNLTVDSALEPLFNAVRTV
jgi:hypothetical protein